MTTPAVTVSKATFTSVQAPASSVGILAILAASSAGTAAVPSTFARADLAQTAMGYGPLPSYGAYTIAVANQPVVLQKVSASTSGSYGSIVSAITGTATVTATSSTHPYDHYAVVVNFLTGGTLGTAGITYQYSIDGGVNFSGVQALGTGLVIAIPNTGVSFTLATTGVGTIIAGDSFSCPTERPLLTDSDITGALAVLGNTRQPFEGVLIDSAFDSATVGDVDTILSGWEGRGMFKYALLNTRYKNEPLPGTETEAAYATAVGTLVGTSASIRVCVGADGAHVPDSYSGANLKRPTSLLLGARASLIPIGEDPAYVARGPLSGAQISDANGNPYDHDEDLYPDLDALRVTTLRSFAPGGPQGVYINNANTIQPTGGAYPYLQHVRIANVACTIAWFVLTTQLSRGVRKNPKADPVTGAVYIFEPDAAAIESLVNDALYQPLKGQVTGSLFSLSRTDNLNTTPCTVSALLSIVALAYIKGYNVSQQFNKTLTTAL